MKDSVRRPGFEVPPAPPEPDTTDYVLIANFRSALREFQSLSTAILKTAGVTSLQYHALVEIRVHRDQEGADISVGQLAKQMLLRHNTAVALIDGLGAQGLVQRARSEQDNRIKEVRLTAAGSLKLRELAAKHREQLGYMHATFARIFAPR